MDDRCCCLHTLVRKYIIFGIGKKMKQNIGIRSFWKCFCFIEIVFWIWICVSFPLDRISDKSDDSFWNWNCEKEIFKIVSFILCSWSSRRYYFAVIDRVTFIIIYYVSYYQRILEELNEKYFWINFMLHGKKHEILRGYYWENNMRAKVNQFTYNVPIYPASKLLIRLLSV